MKIKFTKLSLGLIFLFIGVSAIRSIRRGDQRSMLRVFSFSRTAPMPFASPSAASSQHQPIISPHFSPTPATPFTGSRLNEILQDFEVKRNSTGHIVFARMRGEAKRGEKSETALSSDKVLTALLDATGLSQLEYDHTVPASDVGETSQSFYPQTKEGLRIYPEVGVSILIERGTELVGLDADYVPLIEMNGAPRPSPVPSDKQLVIFYEEKRGKTVGYYAYRTSRNGEETISDARTGKIFVKRSTRQY